MKPEQVRALAADSKRIEKRIPLWERYMWLLAVVWTLLVVASVAWNVMQVNSNTLEVARIQAQTAFEKDVFYRRWNAGYGGVYAPVTDDAPPNPYLADVDERDITTPSGIPLTLINPAYMTRQVHELAEKEKGVLGHITSLDPVRPENAPDSWEAGALRAFERGATVVSSVEEIGGISYMRLMRPLITEAGCLQCHATQGHQEGDIRGGISVSIPMGPLWAVSRTQVRTLALAHALLWLFGLGGIGMVRWQLKRNDQERQHAAADREQLISDLDAYAHSVAHDLKNPLGIILGYSGYMLSNFEEISSEQAQVFVKQILSGSQKMSSIIEDLLLLASIRKFDQIERRPLDMDRIVTEALSRLAPMIEKRSADVVVPDSGTWPSVLGQPLWVEQIWVNYISNALKYGGTPPHIELGFISEVENGKACFWVKDNGAGISREEQLLLFVPFSRLETARVEGHGLGLSIVQRIVEKLDGEVGVHSEVGEGSTFYFKLPIA